MLVFPDGFAALFLPAEMLPASLLNPLLLPPALLPAALFPPARPVVEPFMDEPVVLPLAADPPAADPPPAPPCANANGPATASATARIIVADFMLLPYFDCVHKNKVRRARTFLQQDWKLRWNGTKPATAPAHFLSHHEGNDCERSLVFSA
jgi:hypothetical protein